ncbi:hypothetical protein [Micromonospora craniellae]|nr:hypothetical protein [Micromonospora craniellae]
MAALAMTATFGFDAVVAFAAHLPPTTNLDDSRLTPAPSARHA